MNSTGFPEMKKKYQSHADQSISIVDYNPNPVFPEVLFETYPAGFIFPEE